MSTAVEDPAVLDENPLVEGLERLPVHPTVLVIFGATGDLAHRKLLPAIYNLAPDGALPERFELVGVSRREQPDADFRELASQSIERFSRRRPDPDVLSGLLEDVRYISGTFDEQNVYTELGRTLKELDEKARRTLEPCLLHVDGARVLPGDRRAARGGWAAASATTPRRGL